MQKLLLPFAAALAMQACGGMQGPPAPAASTDLVDEAGTSTEPPPGSSAEKAERSGTTVSSGTGGP